MSPWLWLLIFYLVNYLAAYFLLKRVCVKSGHEWTTGERIRVLFISLFSWIVVLNVLCDSFLEWLDDRQSHNNWK